MSGSPTIDEYRTALQKCVADKASDWKAACESAELASKEINRLRLTDEEREAIEHCAMYVEMDGLRDDLKHAAALRALLKRLG